MHVILAESMGMCFGVRDAVEMALHSPHRTDLTILGELVHNAQVLQRLDAAGVRRVPSVDAPVATSRVMITAHGAARSVIRRLRDQALHVEEATCPLVTHAHRCLDRLVEEGFFPVVIGNPDHVEVRGLVGDLTEYAVIPDATAVGQLAGHSRLGVVSQTTQPIDFARGIVAAIRQAFPKAEVRFVDTVCRPTKERQAAARRLGACCPVVIVIGGRNRNNTRQLLQTCAAAGARAHQVETAADLRPEWFAGVDRVGLTAGTSTPDEIIDEVHRALTEIGNLATEVTENTEKSRARTDVDQPSSRVSLSVASVTSVAKALQSIR